MALSSASSQLESSPSEVPTPEIADALCISPRTVQTHLSHLYAKLGVSGRTEAVAFAVSHNLHNLV